MGAFPLGSSEIALRELVANFGCVGPFFIWCFSQLPFVVQAIQFETRKAGGNEKDYFICVNCRLGSAH